MIVNVHIVEEGTHGKKARQQFQDMHEDTQKDKLDVLAVWNLDGFSRESELSVSAFMAALQD